MAKGRIWGTVCGKYREIEIEECDAIVAIGIKDKGDKIGLQSSALGGELTAEDFVVSVADAVVQAVSNWGESPEEEKVLLHLLANEINRLTKKSSPSFGKTLKVILREVEN